MMITASVSGMGCRNSKIIYLLRIEWKLNQFLNQNSLTGLYAIKQYRSIFNR